ncbi:MAG TPA: hypothetical protein VHI11_05030 [Jiangellaceae bacterium]|jgi:hypothetical protein|nr:hypothetical protein [Jiangellaceae bacterium]
MVDRRRIEELRAKVAQTIREIEELEREAAEELHSPQERRARFRVIRGGKAVVFAPFAWLAARARDHHAAAVAMGSAVFVLGAAGTGVLVGADGTERQTDAPSYSSDSALQPSLAASPSSGSPTPRRPSPDAAGTTREAAALTSPNSQASPSPPVLDFDLPALPELPLPTELPLPSLPAVTVPSIPPPLPTVIPPPGTPRPPTESEALEHCLSLVPPPVDIDACVRDLLG